MPALILLSLLATLVLVLLLPLLYAELMIASLDKLHLSGSAALILVIAVFLGGFVNIPVRRIRRETRFVIYPLAAYGILDRWSRPRRVSQDTLIAVNLGGCLIPVAIALYELLRLAPDARLLVAVAVASSANVFICFRLAWPIPNVGIALPSLIPALVSALLALLLAPDQAPPIAFIAGVAGPLIGADLLHLRNIEDVPAGVLSVGGAGTFDGIALSGIIAAYLA
jgi:uncharacterized membrane protein